MFNSKEGGKFISAIVGIPTLLYVFGLPLLPYVAYLGAFYSLGISTSNLYYLIGKPAVFLFATPAILVLSSVSSFFSYNNLADSIYAAWIQVDHPSITNFFDFWLYTLRVWIIGQRMYDPFWQYWVALPLNLIFSSAFVISAFFIVLILLNGVIEAQNKKLAEAGYKPYFKQSNPIILFLAALFVGWVAFSSINWVTEGSKASLANNAKLANSTKAQKSIPAVIAPNNINTSLPSTTTLSMDGSVTMVKMMKYLREGYKQINPKIQITYGLDPNGKPSDGENIRPTGSSGGLKNLIKGTVTMAASSRPLKPDEAKAGIKLVPIARDAISVVVGVNNPFKGGLTTEQLRQIYQGQITNWSQVGGTDKPIKVYNRGVESGTRDFFKEQVLLGSAFATDSKNFKTWERDETTAVLRVLADDGIYYASVFQAQGQELIRVVPIEGIDPLNKDTIKKKVYPLSRDLYLAIPEKTSPEAKQFIEFARSPQGQQLIEKAEFISIF
jgi:phosphate transport system substrate-binding protein